MAGSVIVDTPKGIACFQMLARKHALRLETLGMRRRGASVFSIIKQEYGLRGSKEKVLREFALLVDRFCRPQPLGRR